MAGEQTIATPSGGARFQKRWLVWTLAGLLIAAMMVGLYLMLNQPVKKTRPTAQQISLVRPNVPPPPPKPPEKLPEPPKVKEEVKMDQPKPVDQPKAAEPPPAERLGVAATGSGAGDGFGLAANPGGRDLLNSTASIGGGGGGGGLGRAQFGFYRDLLTRHVNEELNRIAELKSSSGQVAILVWVDSNGRIERVEMRDATERQNELIRDRLLASRPLREAPPAPMPQPMWILLNLRDLG
jgi:periplasmic protein TonB